MKRELKCNKAFKIRIARKRFYKKISRRNKKYHGISKVAYNPSAPLSRRTYFDLTVPNHLCLEKHYQVTADFLKDLRQSALKSQHPVRLRLEDCEKISPPAMLLLLAEVHRARLLRGDKAVTGTYPRNETLLRRMCHTGFFDLLGIRSPISSSKTFPMEYIKFKSGTKLRAESAKELRNGLLGDSIKLRIKARNQLQRGITEAMLNALQHAYPTKDRRSASVRDRWWLTGHYHQPTGKLSIMFCDLGVGIPSTLPRKHPMEHIRELISMLPGVKPDDGQMILAGMQIGRSSTRQGHRGKGLNDLRQFIDQAGAGELKIFSRAGEYWYNSLSDEGAKNNDSIIHGTLIVWTVPIKAVSEALECQYD